MFAKIQKKNKAKKILLVKVVYECVILIDKKKDFRVRKSSCFF